MIKILGQLFLAMTIQIVTVCEANSQILGFPPRNFADFLQRRFDESSGVFVGFCSRTQLMTNSVLKYEDYVVLPRSSTIGYLIEISRSDPQGAGVVDNLAQLSIRRGHIKLSDNMGGIWTTHTLERAASRILSRPMRFEPNFWNAFEGRQPSPLC